MLTWKCRICGGELTLCEANQELCVCEYCGSKVPVPNGLDEEKAMLYNRANHFRMSGEFDKASVIYEQIVQKDGKEAEAYWGLCLCRYGIEYVTDPKTGRRVPTCHRTLYKSILEDENYLLAMELAKPSARLLYRQEAEYINHVQKQILALSAKNEKSDIFISYKETDAWGKRTMDSVYAQQCYDALTEAGYRVFFSRISLREHIGESFEPYIFSALESAKIMLVVTTSVDHVNAVWVKNEWSRFLKMGEDDSEKKLIVAYKDMNPYALPVEFGGTQYLNMENLGYTQDLVVGIKKLMGEKASKPQYHSSIAADAERLLDNGEAQIKLNNYDAAIEAYLEASKKAPGDWRVWWGLHKCEICTLRAINHTYYQNLLKIIPQGKRQKVMDEREYYMGQRRQQVEARRKELTDKKDAAWQELSKYKDELSEIMSTKDLHLTELEAAAAKKEQFKESIKDGGIVGQILFALISPIVCIPANIIICLVIAVAIALLYDFLNIPDSFGSVEKVIVLPALIITMVLFWIFAGFGVRTNWRNQKIYKKAIEDEKELTNLLAQKNYYQQDIDRCNSYIERYRQEIQECEKELEKVREL